MANRIGMRRLLGFKDFFPNEVPEDKLWYANKVGKEMLYKFACHFLSFFRFNAIPPNEDLLKEWFTFNEFSYDKSPSYHIVAGEYLRLQKLNAREFFQILAVESFLRLFTWLGQHDIPAIDKEDASATMHLFKLYLLFNDDVLKDYQVAADSSKLANGDVQLQRSMLAMSFPQSDLENVDYAQVTLTQFFKAMKLLEFMEANSEYHQLLHKLLKEFHCDSKEEFLKSMGGAVVTSLQNKRPGWTVLKVKQEENFEKGCLFLNRLSVLPDDETLYEQNDYLKLRSAPFQKIDEGHYRVIFDLFLIKKVYNGLYFELSAMARKDKTLFAKDFTGSIRNEFSEAVLVYDVLNEIYSQVQGCVRITGNEFKAIPMEREPDYYLRDGNKILLFESKDFFIRGDIKLSYDFNKIEAELKMERLEKAVKQLAHNIRRTIEKQLVLDTAYNINEIEIYPIIVVHDSLYSAAALNYWIYYWMQEEIEKMKQDPKLAGFDFNRIVPLTIVEIDTLILDINQLKSGQLDLVYLINAFHHYVQYGRTSFQSPEEYEDHVMRSAIPFSEFARDFTHNIGIGFDMKFLLELFARFGVT
jgi:hypothetical protein